MKFQHALAAAVAVVALTGCEVPVEDGGRTAADRAAVNNKQAKGSQAKQAKKVSSETVAQENARRSAAQYLDMSAFSRDGLVKQLKFEGFSQKDAAYGVDAQKANWNKQAAASAENYLEMTSFSRAGLVEQLMFEGFTLQQAEHGVSQVGL